MCLERVRKRKPVALSDKTNVHRSRLAYGAFTTGTRKYRWLIRLYVAFFGNKVQAHRAKSRRLEVGYTLAQRFVPKA